ncbi:hypothetical protein ASS64_09115 [Erythrobacter sp. AP23]|nr:hypothetical protein ASS64_09115 [Erythrobacter sp. AP23]
MTIGDLGRDIPLSRSQRGNLRSDMFDFVDPAAKLGGSSDMFADLPSEPLDRDRFLDEIDGPGIHGVDRKADFAVRRQNHDGNCLRRGRNPVENAQAIHLGHAHIEDDAIRQLELQTFEEIRTAAKWAAGKPMAFQTPNQSLPYSRFVIDDRHARLGLWLLGGEFRF